MEETTYFNEQLFVQLDEPAPEATEATTEGTKKLKYGGWFPKIKVQGAGTYKAGQVVEAGPELAEILERQKNPDNTPAFEEV